MTQKLRKAKAPFYFDLPTEEEWEYACRAGTSTPFAFGESLGNNANYCDSDERRDAWNYGRPHPKSPPRPTPVGSYPPNAWGIYDMHGNVDEWCGAERDDETLSEYDREEYRVFRGGSWRYPASFARSARRVLTYPDIKSETLGFRVVLRDATPSK